MASTTVTAPDGARATRVLAGPFELARLEFPPGYRHGLVDPSRGYVAVVLEGAVCKTFERDSTTLAQGTFATLPRGAAHSSTFAQGGTRVLALRANETVYAYERFLDRRRELRAAAVTALAWRISGELDRSDASAALAIEGLALQLLATVARADTVRDTERGRWLQIVRDALHERVPAQPSLTELATLVGRHPTHVARAFRCEFGQTIGEYARGLRLDWAAARLDAGDPIAAIAHDAGFADQSHFTRVFRAHTGVTPGRYRARASD